MLLSALLGIAAPAHLAAQSGSHPDGGHPDWLNEFSLAASNALVGGVAAGAARALGGGSFMDGFRRGAGGGALHWLGKRMVVAGFDGRHIVGRQVAALGTSVIANASSGRTSFERLFFPVGPVALEIDSRDGRRTFKPSVSVYDLVRIGHAAVHDDLALDWKTSLTTGTTVFQGYRRVLHSRGIDGSAAGSVVHVEEAQPYMREQIIDHEMVHVLQRDLIARAWFYPLERRIIERALGGHPWPAQVRIGVLYPTVKSLFGGLPPMSGFVGAVEAEAEWLEWRGR